MLASRVTLDGDLIHPRRADGRDQDYLLHMNPGGRKQGLLMVYNPLACAVTRALRFSLYYTGLTSTASVRERDSNPVTLTLDWDCHIELPVKVSAHGATWFVLQ